MTQVTRRNNPYAASFESAGSLSASMDKSQQMAYDPTFHLKANVVQRTPVENMITEYQGDTNGGDFDVHSDCSDDHHASLSGSPITTPDSGSQQCCPQHFDAATMTAFLAEMGCIVDCPCPAGSIITVYNGDISQHFNIPSEQVQITRGVIKYADHQTRYGAQTRFRFQLCHNYLQRKCAKLSECSYIHATVLPKPSEVHLNPFAPRRIGMGGNRDNQHSSSNQDDPRVTDSYELMPSGLFIPVSAPATFSGQSGAAANGSNDSTHDEAGQFGHRPTLVESSRLFRTRGSDELFALILNSPPLAAALAQPDLAMQIALQQADSLTQTLVNKARHCAHFQFKRVCNLGVRCQYLHSKDPFIASTRAAVEIAARTAVVNQQEQNRTAAQGHNRRAPTSQPAQVSLAAPVSMPTPSDPRIMGNPSIASVFGHPEQAYTTAFVVPGGSYTTTPQAYPAHPQQTLHYTMQQVGTFPTQTQITQVLQGQHVVVAHPGFNMSQMSQQPYTIGLPTSFVAPAAGHFSASAAPPTNPPPGAFNGSYYVTFQQHQQQQHVPPAS